MKKLFNKMVIVLMMMVAMAFPSCAETSTDSAVLMNEAVAAFNSINEVRKQNGLSELRWMNELDPATMTRAEECAVNMSHVRPDGSAWYTAAPDYLFGENLTSGYDTANDVVNAWMSSPVHKENIMNPYYTGGNIQIVKVNDRCYWVNEFYED